MTDKYMNKEHVAILVLMVIITVIIDIEKKTDKPPSQM